MDIQDIASEQHLRDWLSESITTWNSHNVRKASLEWVEPTFGSSMGLSDCKISYDGEHYGVELKHFLQRRDGVCYKIRPVQRRYNVMGVKGGKRLLILASVAMRDCNDLVLIRGDNIPLRDYCYMDGSGCQNGIKQTAIPLEGELHPFAYMLRIISNSAWWN